MNLRDTTLFADNTVIHGRYCNRLTAVPRIFSFADDRGEVLADVQYVCDQASGSVGQPISTYLLRTLKSILF